MANIRLFDVNWAAQTAGPSPDFTRTEIFFKGCKKAEKGNACPGCFNQPLWNSSAEFTHTPQEIADQIEKFAPNKFVTIGGGEPTDQLEGLVELTALLKAKGFHIMVYTWKTLDSIICAHNYKSPLYRRLLSNIDMLVDGEYQQSERVYSEDAEDGFLNSIGSGNQVVWDIKEFNDNPEQLTINGVAVKDLVGLYLIPGTNELKYITKERIDAVQFVVRQKGAA